MVAEAALEFSSGKYEARISEIGLGGCYVDSISSVVEGESISLTIRFADRTMPFTGEIAYILPGFGFGIRFTNVTEEQTDFLRHILSYPA